MNEFNSSGRDFSAIHRWTNSHQKLGEFTVYRCADDYSHLFARRQSPAECIFCGGDVGIAPAAISEQYLRNQTNQKERSKNE